MGKHPAKCPRCGNRLEFDTAVDERLLCPGCQVLLTFPGKFKPSDKVDPLMGQTLGEFEVIELLGRGGMGAVYKARQPSLDRFVALKVLPRAASRDATFIERFQREARDAAAVNHPNIIQIYAVGQDKGYQYIAMEIVDGESLADLLKREGPLPADRALDLLKQVATALAKAHAAGIVHRDIKPSNILLTVDGHAKVADFGLAKRPGSDLSVTQTGQAMGTPLYWPPEVARGGPADARSDLYSLGAAFYNLLAGHPPFEGATAAELAVRHIEAQAAPLANAAPATPPELCRVIHRLLRKKPIERFQSASDLLEALARVGAVHEPPGQAEATLTVPGAAHVSLVERRGAKARHRRKLLLGGLAAAALLVLVVVLVVVRLSSSRRPAASPPPPSSSAPRTLITEHRTPPRPTPAPAVGEKAPVKQAPPPLWEAAIADADKQADALVRDQRFAAAAALYENLAKAFDDPRRRDRAQKAATEVLDQADAAYRQIEARVKQLLADRKLDDARSALKPVLDRFGLPLKLEAARRLLAEIEAAEKAPATAKDTKKEGTLTPTLSQREREEAEKRREAEARKRAEAEAAFAKALEPVEALVAAWDFSAALSALSKLGPPTPNTEHLTPFSARLSTRRDELSRLAALKAKFIAKINAKKPPFRKGSFFIPGANADLTKADERGITATPPDGKPELVPWPSLSSRSVQALVLQSIDRQSADDWLAAGLLFLSPSASSTRTPTTEHRTPPLDASAAEKHFDKAKELGAAIERYLDPLAAGAFAQAQALLEAKKHTEADSVLAAIEKKYAATPWLAAHRADLASAREAAKIGIAESEAEKLYAEAQKLFEKKELFDLKPLIEKLKTDYPKTRPVTDAARKPSFAEMVKATETLGKFLTVRHDGRGNFKTIRDALDAAPPNSLIEIQDNGPYLGPLVIAKEGTTVRGKKGSWPVIASVVPTSSFEVLAEVGAPGVTIERLILAHRAPPLDKGAVTLVHSAGGFRVRYCVVYMNTAQVGRPQGRTALLGRGGTSESEVQNSILLGPGTCSGRTVLNNCVWSPGEIHGIWLQNQCEARSCTVSSDVIVYGTDKPVAILDSILTDVNQVWNVRTECCNLFGPNVKVTGKGCFSADPQFREPANLDYRLKPTSPCRKRASDGGDIGCRYTPEMLEILEKALELRRKGIIKF